MNPIYVFPYRQLAAFILFFFFLLPSFCFSQPPVHLKKADQLYATNGYHEAVEIYQNTQTYELATLEKLAHSYRLNHDTQNAEKYYALVVDKSYDPLAYLYYAQALQSNGKQEKALEYFYKYHGVMANSNDKRGETMLVHKEKPKAFSNKNIHFYHLANINSEAMDYSPAFYQNGMVFLSTRQNKTLLEAKNTSDKWTGESYSTLYFAHNQSNSVLSKAEPFSLELNGAFHEGPLAFSQKKEVLYYTRNISRKNEEGKKEKFLAITTAKKEGRKWLKDKTLDLSHPNSNNVHPALSPNEDFLVFASDRPGGYGGMDLYIAYFSGGQWGLPVNLGAAINTKGNEVFPFIYQDGSLYFASDGQIGFGGLDVFYAPHGRRWLLAKSQQPRLAVQLPQR